MLSASAAAAATAAAAAAGGSQSVIQPATSSVSYDLSYMLELGGFQQRKAKKPRKPKLEMGVKRRSREGSTNPPTANWLSREIGQRQRQRRM